MQLPSNSARSRSRTARWSLQSIRRVVTALSLAAAFAAGARPAEAQSPAQAQEPGSELTVYLMTMGVGDAVYERFGHNAIWIHDAAHGTDIAYNWGEFSFDQPGFLGNFLKGRVLYWMGPRPMDEMLYVYRYLNRSVWAQELNLTPAQKKSLQEFVEWNALPENKRYLYDYYRDNCSTRVRDALDHVLNGELRQQLEPRSSGQTYRSETRRLMLTDMPILTGMDLAMGPLLDHRLSAWDDGFIPMKLRDWVREVTVDGPGGQRVPLVKSEQTIFEASRAEPPGQAPNLLPRYLLVGLFFGGLLLLGSMSTRWARALFGALAAAWTLVVGLLGTIILCLWLFTDHTVTYRNINLLLASPLSLVLFGALLGMSLGKTWGWKLARRTSVASAGLGVLALMLSLVPGPDQSNGTIIALLLPANVALALVITRWKPARQAAGLV